MQLDKPVYDGIYEAKWLLAGQNVYVNSKSQPVHGE
jgi:hypothetical protein